MLFNRLITTKVYTKTVSKNKLHIFRYKKGLKLYDTFRYKIELKIDIINQFGNFIATFIVFLSKFKLIHWPKCYIFGQII